MNLWELNSEIYGSISMEIRTAQGWPSKMAFVYSIIEPNSVKEEINRVWITAGKQNFYLLYMRLLLMATMWFVSD